MINYLFDVLSLPDTTFPYITKKKENKNSRKMQDEQHQYVPPGSDEVLKPLLYQENSRMSSCAEITRINMDNGYTVA